MEGNDTNYSVMVWCIIGACAIVQLLHKENNSHIKLLLKYSYLLVYLAALFYGQNYFNFLYSRFIHAALFPFILCLGDYFYEKNTYKNGLLGIHIIWNKHIL